jgi:hypothetical protein
MCVHVHMCTAGTPGILVSAGSTRALSDLRAVKKDILESTTSLRRSCRLIRVLHSFVQKVAQKMQDVLHLLSVLTWQSVKYSN